LNAFTAFVRRKGEKNRPLPTIESWKEGRGEGKGPDLIAGLLFALQSGKRKIPLSKKVAIERKGRVGGGGGVDA